MNENDAVRIRLVSGAAKAWLCLEGTILSFREKAWSRETALEIPLELVTVSECRRLMGTRLIAALLALLFLPAIGGAILGLWYLVAGPAPERVVAMFMGTGGVFGLVAFLVLLARFFVRQTAITLTIAPDNVTIPFWLEAKRETALRGLLNDMSRRKAALTESMAHPMKQPVGDVMHQPWKRTVALAILCSIPACVLEIPWLLAAGAIPIVLHLMSLVAGMKEPPALRRAIRLYRQRAWGPARDAVESLLRERTDHRPARLLLIELLIKLAEFDRAESILAELQPDLEAETVQTIQQELIQRRRVFLRKE